VKKYLWIGDMGLLSKLGSYNRTQLRSGDNFVEVVGLHDLWDGTAGFPEEMKDPLSRLFQ
jgi:hypothetical protein